MELITSDITKDPNRLFSHIQYASPKKEKKNRIAGNAALPTGLVNCTRFNAGEYPQIQITNQV